MACFWDKHETAYVKEPFVNQGDVVAGFDRLRAAGLRVSIPESFTVGSLQTPGVQSALPHGGMVGPRL